MTRQPGRPRDPEIDSAVLGAVLDQLAAHGYEGMSLVRVAEEAGTTRQAVYRRWKTKADLATAAISSMSRANERIETDDPFADLVAELRSFQAGVTRPHGVSMAISMLHESTDDEVKRLFRDRIVSPRRARVRAILERAVDRGLLDSTADVELSVATSTGSLYALRLAGKPIPRDWALRSATLVWRSMGGSAPS
ncbi:MAG: TetR/AcrR family transcriptional regulator [Actinomycetota bacterium]